LIDDYCIHFTEPLALISIEPQFFSIPVFYLAQVDKMRVCVFVYYLDIDDHVKCLLAAVKCAVLSSLFRLFFFLHLFITVCIYYAMRCIFFVSSVCFLLSFLSSSFIVSTSAIHCLERLDSEITYCVSSGTLNPTHSLTLHLVNCRC